MGGDGWGRGSTTQGGGGGNTARYAGAVDGRHTGEKLVFLRGALVGFAQVVVGSEARVGGTRLA